MKSLPLSLAFFALLSSAFCADSPRERYSLDTGWTFNRGDAPGAEKPAYDSASWKAVTVPDDYSLSPEPGKDSIFDKGSPAGGGGGYINGGIGWYRKTLKLPGSLKGKRVFVEFEGVYMDSNVWLNGQLLGNHPYGYTSFEYELTPLLKWDEDNVLAVRCDVQQPCSRWYSGAGIYRHVWLHVTDPVHVASHGTYVATPQVTDESAQVHVCTQVLNQADGAAGATVRTFLDDPAGDEVTKAEAQASIDAGGSHDFEQSLQVPKPARWSLEKPQLYTARTEVVVSGKVVDTYRTPFGIRTIEFTKDRGFLLNGQHVQIQGVCDHHDQGCLGAAAYDRAIVRQLEILKSMGCNAIRTSHNPPAPALLDACDRLGFVVMDEAFDEWKHNKTKLGYGRFFDEWSERDIVSMLRRDRNHPSVVLWSIGNEIPEQSAANGHEMAQRLADFCHREDPTRPVTSACSSPGPAVKTGFADALDVMGINYSIGAYENWKGQRALIGSETSSTVSSRGEYNLVEKEGKLEIEPQLNTQVTSYDTWKPGWAVLAERQLKTIADDPWMTGEFVWTGFDYIGEPTPFPWPAASSYFGIVDLCGFPKDRYYLYQSRWTAPPMVHILPHWNWPQFAGKEVPVWCYSNAQTVELFLNGKSLGEKEMAAGSVRSFPLGQRKDKDGTVHPVEEQSGWYHVEWFVPFEPGELKAVAKRHGEVVATDIVATAGQPAKLALSVDRPAIRAGGQDLAFLTVQVLDEKGHVCPEAAETVKFEIEGPGIIAGVGNGDATSHEEFRAKERKAFHGRCLAVVRSAGGTGMITVKAAADGLAGAESRILVGPVPAGTDPQL